MDSPGQKERKRNIMRINNNIMALNSHRVYGINANNLGRDVERLSSGFRVNRAADDAAGLAISEKMRAQIRGLNMASRNSLDGISLVQTAEGGMQTIQDILQRMRELAIQAGNDTNQFEDRAALQLEVNQLIEEIDQIADTTEFNEMTLLSGRFGADGGVGPSAGPLILQVGANMQQAMYFHINSMNASGLALLGVGPALPDGTARHSLVLDDPLTHRDRDFTAQPAGIMTHQLASAAITIISDALLSVSMARAALGAIQNRLEFKIQNLDNQAENLQAAESRIRDADMARVMTNFTRNNILFQSSTAMLAQANALPQSVLQLLG